ncbi:MAG: glutaredoxin family protein [Pseudomonadales bacterium]
MTLTLTLYTTDHCELCDRAFDWLLQCEAVRGAQLETVDVSTSDDLMQRFGTRIPVLLIRGQPLDWPFSEAGIEKLMANPAG